MTRLTYKVLRQRIDKSLEQAKASLEDVHMTDHDYWNTMAVIDMLEYLIEESE